MFERGFRGLGSSLPSLLASRWRELVGVADAEFREDAAADAPAWACAQLEAAAYASTRARRGAWARGSARGMAPYTFASLERVLELAHHGRQLAEDARAAALERASHAAAISFERPDACELGGELAAIDVGPVADVKADRAGLLADARRLEETMRLEWLAADDLGDTWSKAMLEREFASVFGRPMRGTVGER